MSYYSSTLQKGSKGDEVKKWQEYLNTQGYGLSVDGDFGNKTYAATTDWQTKNGLGADGIVGKNTWGKAGFTNLNTPISAPSTNPMPTAPTYDTQSWDDTTKGQGALGAYTDAKDAVSGYDPFTFSQNEWLENVKQGIQNYGDFSYNFNEDALYQQYKDQYIQQGKLAMADTMGQAAAMTGGYGNSYAQSVGQQAYQGQLDNLNDVIPELYQMALNRYNMGKEDLYNQYGMLMSEYEREYGLHSDEYNKLLDQLGIAKDDYYSGGDMFYNEQDNKNAVAGQEFTDAMNIWSNETEQAWNQATWDEDARRRAEDLAWEQKVYEESKASVGSGGSNNGGNGGNGGNGDNGGGIDNAQIPDNIKQKAATFESNDALANWAYGLADSGAITEEQADQLISTYMDQNEKYADNDDGSKSISYSEMVKSTNGWSVVDNGGVNWLWGVDNNARVKAPNGEIVRLDNLVDYLVNEGMQKSDAKSYVKKLQKNLGV